MQKSDFLFAETVGKPKFFLDWKMLLRRFEPSLGIHTVCLASFTLSLFMTLGLDSSQISKKLSVNASKRHLR